MWSAVVPCDVESSSPSSRSKHTATLVGQHIYLLGGRNGNLPLKDFWRYNLVTGKWQQLYPTGVKLPSLQEHTAVVYKDKLYVFGGEVAFSTESETPLWVYDIKNNTWGKIRTQKGAVTPKGRRGHTALIHKGTMLIYGGYQDLRGSCSELWVYHFDTESWHLVSTSSKHNSDISPPARHKHSAIFHNDSMWIYGGMTDLQERSDLWKWDTVFNTWTLYKTKQNPGQLHSHAACRLPSSMIIFGGERDGHPVNDLWKFSFNTELWEKIVINGIKPQPRAETVTITVPQVLLNDSSANSLESGNVRTRARTCNATNHRHSSYVSNNRVTPNEKTYVFKPSVTNYVDGSELAQQFADNENRLQNNKGSFLQEISKLSNLNIPKFNNKCNYTVLSGCTTESTESLLKQYATLQGFDNGLKHKETTPPTRGTLVKSKSAYAVKRREIRDISPNSAEINKMGALQSNYKHVEFAAGTKKITREPISVPNFSLINLPTPSLTPVEAAQLVFVDSDGESYADDVFVPPVINNLAHINTNNSQKDLTLYENFKVVKRGESYSSHLGYADNPLYQHMINSNKTQNQYETDEASNENISATSDYASLETVNRLSSTSSYNGKTAHETVEVGPFGFCNPNYMGPGVNSEGREDKSRKREMSKILNTHDKSSESNAYSKKYEENSLELQSYNGVFDRNTKVLYRNSARNIPPRSLAIEKSNSHSKPVKCRASSASRVEKNTNKVEPSCIQHQHDTPLKEHVSFYIFVVGGKEQGQVTVFKRPLSVWRLNLF